MFDKVNFLQELGLSQEHSLQVASEIDSSGCVLEQLNAHPHVIKLVASLHTYSWFRVGESEEHLSLSVRAGAKDVGSEVAFLI